MATDPTISDTPQIVPDIATGEPSGTQGGAKPTIQSLKDEAQNLAGTAKTAALNAAATGKDKAADALSEAASFIENAAQTLDEKVGNGVGDYARKAGAAATNLSDSLKTKNVDELVEDAKSAVRKNPAIAVGAAAAVGFLLTRIFRLGGRNDRS
ncbi:MAG TPA: hypothetical protein VL405_03480 [Sphingomonas sp.]|jgi:ElaB/YqjD/DUF883 family membrane-anchored ribosome-binding protein|nr:hypothetical protein [Sphingomonas sp.]